MFIYHNEQLTIIDLSLQIITCSFHLQLVGKTSPIKPYFASEQRTIDLTIPPVSFLLPMA
jgi:hypothetical protein